MKITLTKIIKILLCVVVLMSLVVLVYTQFSVYALSAMPWLSASFFILMLVALCLAWTFKHQADFVRNESNKLVEMVDQLLSAQDISVQMDVVDQGSALYKVRQLILFDKQTQLPNKIEFCRRIKQLVYTYQQDAMPFTLVKLELNAFDEMLEVIGRRAGVSLMHCIVNRLSSIVPETVTISKLGSNSLGLLLPNVSNDDIHRYAENILRAFIQPFNIKDKSVILAAHMGIVCYPDHSKKKSELLANAELALTYAKSNGKSAYQIYQQEYSKVRAEHAEIEGALHHALLNNELELYFQPQVDIVHQEVIGAEALLRWYNPKLGMVAPDKFIPIAEANGTIIEIGDWVLLTAFRSVVIWNSGRETPLKIAINLSVRQFYGNDLAAKITRLLNTTGCKAEWIKLEITESLLLDKSDEVLKALLEIAELGIPISLDDFGTGYSSLSYLTRYPISQIKIDRSFVSDIPMFLEKCELVKLIVKIADTLHFDVVAEGIETLDQLDWLRQTSCHVVQGYYFYKPMPFNAFDLMVKALSDKLVSPSKLLAKR
jgi:diguanylate cyclase (GGDEF)-like protein